VVVFVPLEVIGPVEDVKLIMRLWSERVGGGLDAVCVHYRDAGRLFVRIESGGVVDAGALARDFRVGYGGEGGGSKRSAVWTVKSEELV
jgi:hypothetical protein